MEYPQYTPATADLLPLSDEELAGLDDILASLPSDGAMNIEAMDGYLTGLLLSPVDVATLPGGAWLPLIWGGDGEGNLPFASGKQRKKTVLLLLRHLHSIACLLRDRPAGWEPIFSVAEQGEEELADAEDWCTGFMLAVDLAPEAWAPRFESPALAEVLHPIVLLGGDEAQLSEADRALLADPASRDALSRSVPDTVLALYTSKT